MPDDLAHIQQLIRRMVDQDDPQASRDFFDLFYLPLTRFALVFVYRLEAAEDVVSTVFYQVFKQKKRLLAIQDIRYYLYRAVRNQAITYQKRNKLYTSDLYSSPDIPIQDVEHSTPESEYVFQELSEIVRNIIEKMPPQRRTVYQLVFHDRFKYREVAELLQISEKTVENHMRLAIRDVRQQVQSAYENQEKDSARLSC